MESAILVAVYQESELEAKESLDELAFLAQSAQIKPCEQLLQKRAQFDPTYYIGKGKVDELKALVDFHQASAVIFDDELRSSQVRNLKKELKVEVIDRSELILHIFASRARSRQAKLQVEAARLKYEMSRLRRLWTHFGKIDGGIGSRGMGETQLEVDRRRNRERIYSIERLLKSLDKKQAVQRKRRQDVFKVSLVGYTNAGKSTLINAIAGAGVWAEDQLFATLDTTTRRVELDSQHPFLLSDTVGFIKKLPHHLVTSFNATLAEVKEADLLLHVVDASHPKYEDHIDVVNTTLQDIGCEVRQRILVFNKTDRIASLQRWDERIEEKYGHLGQFVFLSALKGFGVDRLLGEIRKRMDQHAVRTQIGIDLANGKALAFVRAHAEIVHQDIVGEKQVFDLIMDPRHYGQLKAMLK